MSRLNPGRLAAAQVGMLVRERGAFTSDVLDKHLPTLDLSRSDAAFARALSLGVTSSLGTLDETIDRCLRSPDDIKDDVRDCLRVSTYEIMFMDKAGYAALDQGVELVRAIQPKASRLANAALRKVLAAKDEFPFGDPATDDAALARLHAFPVWLAKRLIQWIGREEADRFMHACNQPAPVFLAVNACKTSDGEVRRLFSEQDIVFQPVSLRSQGPYIPGCLLAPSQRIVASRSARTLFSEGKILVSDAAAQAIAQLALPEKMPRRFLEVGSGRGTKTILLQSGAMRRFGNQMELVSMDAHGFKADLLRKRARTYGVELSGVVSADARGVGDDLGLFDTVFIDAPCSGLGTLRRHPEIRWRLTPEGIANMVDIQVAMMENLADRVAPSGRLVYATCTVASEENEYAIKRFLETERGSQFGIYPCAQNSLSKLFFKTRLTERGCDAHFAAILQRRN